MFRDNQNPQNDFSIDDDGGAAAGHNETVKKASSSSAELEPDGPCDEEHNYETLNNPASSPSCGQRPSSHEYGNYVPIVNPPSGAAAAAENFPPHTSAQVEYGGPRREGQVHGQEYDFSKQETRNVFSAFPGWSSNISESQIKNIMEPYLGEDGRYVLWYWTELKRPAISVIYAGMVKNFIVHKRPSRSTPEVVKYFYINKQQHCDKSMMSLMRFHLNRGIQNTEPDCQHQLIPLSQHLSI
ncbi:hypothetical protein ElyMa_005130200 [Elysia marginata]|uniref:Uncharacterized protein n=1 Tax=Elysia marginata TaxID=1093978 RepID=A0AAV4JKL0_9GAST|nr:hypothetical protein ElyMa_005130200 [Elysia marginata]